METSLRNGRVDPSIWLSLLLSRAEISIAEKRGKWLIRRAIGTFIFHFQKLPQLEIKLEFWDTSALFPLRRAWSTVDFTGFYARFPAALLPTCENFPTSLEKLYTSGRLQGKGVGVVEGGGIPPGVSERSGALWPAADARDVKGWCKVARLLNPRRVEWTS